MKNLFIATLAAAAMFASCNDNTIDVTPIDPASGPQVQITFGTGGQTRAFFEDSAAGEEWENAIHSLEIYVYDSSGKYQVKHSLTESEIATKSARFALPPTVAATSCTFFAIANCANWISSTSSINASQMDVVSQSWLHIHNGTFDEVSTGSKRQEGFLMTDKVRVAIAPLGSATTVPLTLKRDVAKIALRIGLDDDFKKEIETGSLTINSVTISKMNINSNVFQPTPLNRALGQSYAQIPARNGEYFDALFYIYPNGKQEAGNRVLLTLTGYYDADGDDSTTEDRTTVVYNLELDGTNSDGSIERNVYYRVNAVIEGLSGDSLTSNYVVANWTNIVNQTTKIGS